jgi:hypothetical protein
VLKGAVRLIDGQIGVCVVITTENVLLLTAGHPMFIDIANLAVPDGPPTALIIQYARSDAEAVLALQIDGKLPEGSTIDTIADDDLAHGDLRLKGPHHDPR